MPTADARFPYQDPTLAPAARAQDLVSRMSIEDKAGTMFLSIVVRRPAGRAETSTGFGLPSLAVARDQPPTSRTST